MINLEILKDMFTWAFNFLNLTITIPINWAGTEKLSFPLYYILIIIFIIEMIKVLWAGMMYSKTDVN